MRGRLIALVIAAVLEYGWLAFDGSRALIVGDYVTPSSGAHAGELGPWAIVVSAVGIDPRSTVVKSAHVVMGLGGLVSAAAFVSGVAWGRIAAVVSAGLCLCYLPFGTLLNVAQIGILISHRGGKNG